MVTAQATALEGPANVRFGSKADMCSAKRHVRFTPESGHTCEPLFAAFPCHSIALIPRVTKVIAARLTRMALTSFFRDQASWAMRKAFKFDCRVGVLSDQA